MASRPSRSLFRRRAFGPEWTGLYLVVPFLVVFAIGIVAPLLYAMYLSLYRDQMVGGNIFVGLDNYFAALVDPLFYTGLGHVALYVVIQVPIMVVLALVAALALDSRRMRGRSLFRIALFLPFAVPSVVAALMWGFLYGNDFGLVGQIRDFTGIDIPNLLSSDWILASLGNITTWGFTGYNMLIFYAALKAIPEEIYEAADLDGAGEIKMALHIKLPQLGPAIVLAVVFAIISSFQLFNEPSVVSTLAPTVITTYFTPNMYAYNLSVFGQQYNYSAALAVLLGLITAIAALAVHQFGRWKWRDQ